MMLKALPKLLIFTIVTAICAASGPAQTRVAYKGTTPKAPKSSTKKSKDRTAENELADTKEIAIYQYDSAAANLDPSCIKYNVKKEGEVKEIVQAFGLKEEDGRDMGAAPSAYIYFKLKKGSPKVGRVIGFDYILIGDDWSKLHPLTDRASEIIESNIQIKPKVSSP